MCEMKTLFKVLKVIMPSDIKVNTKVEKRISPNIQLFCASTINELLHVIKMFKNYLNHQACNGLVYTIV